MQRAAAPVFFTISTLFIAVAGIKACIQVDDPARRHGRLGVNRAIGRMARVRRALRAGGSGQATLRVDSVGATYHYVVDMDRSMLDTAM